MEVCFAERLTKQYRNEEGRGPEIYIKRDRDVLINPFRDHKIISSVIIKVMAAKRKGKSVIAATGGSQGQLYGFITAAACHRHGLDCTIFMGSEDINKQSLNLQLITSLGAQVKWVEGNLKQAVLEAKKELIRKSETSLLVVARDEEPNQFQETKRQGMDKLGGTADILILGCIESSASNVLRLFLDHYFIQKDKDVRLILVQPDNGIMHSASQIMIPHPIGEGLESQREKGLKYLSFLKEIGKVEFYTVTDMEVMEARNLYFKLESNFPSKEASYAFAYLHKLCPTLSDGCKVVVHCGGQ
ncbi:tryptophan synthase beta chain 2, chloroplastic [Cucumis sativus]|nr:tryptophan synthase beta chain 2, chloroplastic [Cucumis sativus]KAE8652670.1 hypothetical protein Csa_013304 [Cucumis sativus]